MLKDGKTVFNMTPSMFANYVDTLLESGVNLLGGCCGTTPQHIAEAAAKVKTSAVALPGRADASGIISSNRSIKKLAFDNSFTVIGERINPTGKKALQAELRSNSTALALQFAIEQQTAGAEVLDINMGLSGVDETALMRKVVLQTVRAVDTPLCIDSTSPAAVEAALRVYPGRALLNSISYEKERLEKVLPIAARYGAMLILLPLDENKLPENCAERIAVLEKLLPEIEKYNYNLNDVAVDALIMAVSAAPQAGNAALDFIDYCHNTLKVNTVCGLSNISFGLPNRMLVNRTFLAMAMAKGLNMAIANPMNSDFMAAIQAVEALNSKDKNMSKYLAAQSNAAAEVKAAAAAAEPRVQAFNAVLRGDTVSAVKAVQSALTDPALDARNFLNKNLLSAIEEVGKKFEKKEYFLPQLLAGAEALQAAIETLEPALKSNTATAEVKEKFIIATVKGDIHDIGKNIVSLMLRNSGFEVIDLGKDVAAETIIERAKAENCRLIGLSALMTTTMSEMPKVIELARSAGLQAEFIVGGAVVDDAFASQIGASYAADAMMAVRIAQSLTKK